MAMFFSDNMELKKLQDTCQGWLGTPYLHMGSSRGGVDCTKFIGLILCELGIITQIKNDYYPRDWHIHGHREVVLESFVEHAKSLRIGLNYSLCDFAQESDLLPGDVLCISLNGRLCNHTAFYFGSNKIIHCVQRLGVIEAQLFPQWYGKIKKIFRLMELSNGH